MVRRNGFRIVIALFLVLALFAPSATLAHPGRTDRNGGHTCRTNCKKWGLRYGQYHYHYKSIKNKR